MKTVMLLSGGLDSTTLLWELLSQGSEVYCLTVNYGQRHVREIDACMKVVDRAVEEFGRAGMREWRLLDLRDIAQLMLGYGSSQVGGTVAVPEGHYAAESMKVTVVPNRNMLMLSAAASWALSVKAESVAFAAHRGDHDIYPDCRPEFVDALAAAFRLCDYQTLDLQAPFRLLTKEQIVRQGSMLRVPFGLTWSCYKGGTKHCARCGTCVERREAFELANVPDPTEYIEYQEIAL